jgi:hypothetical protein
MAHSECSAACERNDRYFQKHFARLVGKHGGKWIVLPEGELIGIGEQTEVPALIRQARKKHPHSVPFASPIPARHELQCLL